MIGVYLRSQVDLANGFATILTRYFGVFQAVFLREPLKVKKEAVAEAPRPEPQPPAPAEPPRRTRQVARGFATTAFGNGEARDDGLAGSFWHLSAGRVGTVGQDSVLRSER